MAIEWQRIEPTIVTKVSYRTIVDKNFVLPDGSIHTFTTLHAEASLSAAVVALTPDGLAITARQFRAGPERILHEIPGGGVEAGEEPLQAAIRELAEETGYVPGAIVALGSSCRDAYTNSQYYYFFATNCVLRPEGQALDEHEYIDVVLLSIPEFIAMAKQDQMSDPAAVLFAYDKLIAYMSAETAVL